MRLEEGYRAMKVCAYSSELFGKRELGEYEAEGGGQGVAMRALQGLIITPP